MAKKNKATPLISSNQQGSTPLITPEAATPAPNVIWSSEKKEDGSLKYGNPPERVRIGMLMITVPKAEVQLKGFYSEHARLLARSINGFKKLQPKG